VGLTFEWDARKAARNLRIHQISFTEAATLFDDPLSATLNDPDHSDDEDRFLIFGRSNRGRLLVLSFTERGERIRLISARSLTPKERRGYEETE
jgi:uncharacterized protein